MQMLVRDKTQVLLSCGEKGNLSVPDFLLCAILGAARVFCSNLLSLNHQSAPPPLLLLLALLLHVWVATPASDRSNAPVSLGYSATRHSAAIPSRSPVNVPMSFLSFFPHVWTSQAFSEEESRSLETLC